MEQTTNYQLKKPAASDYIAPDPFNENADIIDAELAKRALAADLTAHAGNAAIHVTAAQKTKWDGYETVHTLTHSRSAPGRFHALTGLNGATGVLSCQFKATAAFAAGDTVKVDGTAYTVKLQNGETAEDKLFVSGALVSCIIDTAGKTVNFKAGGASQLKKYAAGSVTLTMASNKKGSGSVTGLGFTPQVILLSNNYITEHHQVFIKEKSHAYRHDLGYTSQYHHEDESPSLFSVSKGGFQVKDLPFDSYYANNWDTGYTLEVSYWCYG